jgi:tetratricopeptide (TPR) repeat protein
LFPLHDASGTWRHGIWLRAREIYQELLTQEEAILAPELATLNEELRRFEDTGSGGDGEYIPAELVSRSMDVDIRGRELDQWKAASLYYLFLFDFEAGCRELLSRFEQAEREHDTFLQDLLVLYLQRFLPGGAPATAFNDVVGRKLEEFRTWLVSAQPSYYLTIGLMVAKHLIDSAQPEAAVEMIDGLPASDADHRQQHGMHLLRGDAFMRIPRMVNEALTQFEHALANAHALESDDRYKLIAEAHKEEGFFYRNTGQWDEANLAYRHARDAMSARPPAQRSKQDRGEIASIHTNWAYVMGLTGRYRDALELVESAIAVRHNLARPADEGLSWSVRGEVYRYARRFERAWEAYGVAETLLQGRKNWNRLGFVLQEQAICLYQAALERISLTSDPISEAKNRITRALDICLSHSIRGYPSALNRAGRIFGHDDPRAGLEYLKRGIVEAQRLSDGWFWFANVVEYAELRFRLWQDAADAAERAEHRREIAAMADEVMRLDEEYSFPDLSGRWLLLQAHLAMAEYLTTREPAILDSALDSYQTGFARIAARQIGSSGAASISREFSLFRKSFGQLPAEVKQEWQAKLRSAWALVEDGATLLLARLEELD